MAHAKHPLKHRQSPAPASHNDRDAAIAKIIAGLNYLGSQSQEADLGTAARILSVAKEDMVHWAVDMNFHESARDRFINSQLFGPLGNGVSGLMSHMDRGTGNKTRPQSAHKKS